MNGTSGNDQQVLQRLIMLFEMARERNYHQAAHFIAYRGSDKSREYQGPFNYDIADERRPVEALLNRIAGWLEDSDDHDFGEYLEQETDGRKWHAWEVIFQKGGERKVRYFGFLHLNGQFLLGDIDR